MFERNPTQALPHSVPIWTPRAFCYVFFCFLLPPLGLKGSLQRLQLEYVDVVFANRPDSNTPMEGE